MALLHGVLPQSSTSSYHMMEELNLLGANNQPYIIYYLS